MAPTGPAAVMADVGGDVGAAVVYTPAALARARARDPARRPRRGTEPTPRSASAALGASRVWAGFFGALPAGRYEVRLRGDASRSIDLSVVGATVTETSYNW